VGGDSPYYICHRGVSYVRQTDSDILGSEHHLWGESAEY